MVLSVERHGPENEAEAQLRARVAHQIYLRPDLHLSASVCSLAAPRTNPGISTMTDPIWTAWYA